MEKMTREQWIAEFGEPSVENPAIVDLIEVDEEDPDAAEDFKVRGTVAAFPW